MMLRQKLRVALGVVVLGSLLGLVIYADATDLASGAQAALFALIAATGLAVVRGNRADQTWKTALNGLVSLAALAAAVLSAYTWLISENAGTAIEVAGAAGAALAALAFFLNIDDVEATTKERKT